MKTLLFLINGFGIENKKSYSIYNKDLMPNLDKLTKQYMFSPIKTNVTNYRDGYRNLSLEINEIYNYSIFQEIIDKGELFTNPVYINIKKEFNDLSGKLHIFCLIDNSEKIIEQLKIVIKDLYNVKKKIFLHIVLTSSSNEDYKIILKILSKLNVELSEYLHIGLVMGLGTIVNNNSFTEFNYFFKLLIDEVGEKWQSFSQKINVSYALNQPPNLVKPFIVNNGFSIDKDDLFMIWNYDKIDLTTFVNMLKNIQYGKDKNNFKLYSLFQITSKDKVDYMLNYHPALISLANNLKAIDSRALILAKKEQINIINYYANGLQSIVNDRIIYIEADNYLFKPKELLSIINTYNQELIIINYDLDNAKNIEELKQLLHNIDIMIGDVYNNSLGSKYTMIVSSLYGIDKVMKNSKDEICHVIFSEKVPLVFIDDFITRKTHIISEGSIVDLLPICYKKMSSKYLNETIITKMNALYRIFFK